jgi:hypothetical protein
MPEPLPTAKSEPVRGNRVHQGFRLAANLANPDPRQTVYDSRGRPKQRTSHHQWIGSGK